MMNYDGKIVKDEFKEAFGKEITELSSREIWWLIKLAKHVRGRCRSNAALKNYLVRNFPGHEFKEVEKKGLNGKTYTTLSIYNKAKPEDKAEDDGNEE